MLNHRSALPALFLFASVLKFSLFFYTEQNAPDAKFQVDSQRYIVNAQMLARERTFAFGYNDGKPTLEFFRTPGYPFFLSLFLGLGHFSFSRIIFFQILLTLLTAYLTYKTAALYNSKIALLSATIILFDLSITVHSLMILSETLFLFLMAGLAYAFLRYLRDKSLFFLCLSALILAMATFVRPISFYLALPLGLLFFFSKENISLKKNLTHALIFLILVYGPLGMWQARNYHQTGRFFFSSITEWSKSHGLLHSYARREDPVSTGLPAWAYYPNVASRCLLSLLTRPASLKYFHSTELQAAGKIFDYLWIDFWLTGFLIGIWKGKKDVRYFALLGVAGYLIVASIVGGAWVVGSRFRVPLMPFIAILSAAGWSWLASLRKQRKA